MTYPSLEQYNEALQYPQTSLLDAELKGGKVATSGLGLPLALCGGFALTYTIETGNAKYAVRCFHKESNALQRRYEQISSRLKSIRSHYFVDFSFQPQGVRVRGRVFPVVKMAWASGETLGEFLENRYQDKHDLTKLRDSLRRLGQFLEAQEIAHGDIQPGNVMVTQGGRSIQVIDYDGVFVPELRSLGAAELGHRNFQHPCRDKNSWDRNLDRFSLISLELAIRALETDPDLWRKTNSDGEAFLFRAADFTDPSGSKAFHLLFGRSELEEDAKNFARICAAGFGDIPTLADFLVRKNIPQVSITISRAPPPTTAKYASAYPVLDAKDFQTCLSWVGDRVELVGKIVEVKRGKTKYGKPYIFVNFAPWQGNAVKLSIWSEGLEKLSRKPDRSWVGKWVSVVGLMEPPFENRRLRYTHLSITITQANQISRISDQEGKTRLSAKAARSGQAPLPGTNQRVLEGIRGNRGRGQGRSPSNLPSVTPNQAVLQAMKGSGQPAQTPQTPATAASSGQVSRGRDTGCLGVLVMAIIYVVLALLLG